MGQVDLHVLVRESYEDVGGEGRGGGAAGDEAIVVRGGGLRGEAREDVGEEVGERFFGAEAGGGEGGDGGFSGGEGRSGGSGGGRGGGDDEGGGDVGVEEGEDFGLVRDRDGHGVCGVGHCGVWVLELTRINAGTYYLRNWGQEVSRCKYYTHLN